MSSAGASHIAMEFGLIGPAFTVSSACSSASHAIGPALWVLRGGRADAALAGGSEAPFGFASLKAWEAMRVIAPDICRPFPRDRKGMNLGEGGAMLVLEPLDAARGARASTRSWPPPVSRPDHRLHQRPWHRHARQRPRGNPGDPRRLRRPRVVVRVARKFGQRGGDGRSPASVAGLGRDPRSEAPREGPRRVALTRTLALALACYSLLRSQVPHESLRVLSCPLNGHRPSEDKSLGRLAIGLGQRSLRVIDWKI
jgi:hypothetical protein